MTCAFQSGCALLCGIGADRHFAERIDEAGIGRFARQIDHPGVGRGLDVGANRGDYAIADHDRPLVDHAAGLWNNPQIGQGKNSRRILSQPHHRGGKRRTLARSRLARIAPARMTTKAGQCGRRIAIGWNLEGAASGLCRSNSTMPESKFHQLQSDMRGQCCELHPKVPRNSCTQPCTARLR